MALGTGAVYIVEAWAGVAVTVKLRLNSKLQKIMAEQAPDKGGEATDAKALGDEETDMPRPLPACVAGSTGNSITHRMLCARLYLGQPTLQAAPR